MLPTSARVAQEVYEPLIGIHYPMLCTVKNGNWQIGTGSIRAEDQLATGFRFVNWVHDVSDPEIRAVPPPAATNTVYRQIEQWPPMTDRETDSVLALTTRTLSAQHLQGFFQQSGRRANAETAVKVAGATAKHCVVLHGKSTFLSGSSRSNDFDHECYTRANVAYSRATDLTVSACPVNMHGATGVSQVIAALLHGVCTLYTNDQQTSSAHVKLAPAAVVSKGSSTQPNLSLQTNPAVFDAWLKLKRDQKPKLIDLPNCEVTNPSWLQTSAFFVPPAIGSVSAVVTPRDTGSAELSVSQWSSLAAQRLRYSHLGKTDDRLKWQALRKLKAIVLQDPGMSKLGRNLISGVRLFTAEENWENSFSDCFQGKSVATLCKRAGALWRYSEWLASNNLPVVVQSTESLIYRYVVYLKEHGKPTTATSFTQAWNFLHHSIGLLTAGEIVSSRVRGAARARLALKRPLQQAAPLSVKMIVALENVFRFAPYTHWRIVAGHLLMCLGSCSRFGDTMQLVSLKVSSHKLVQILEGESKFKTSHSEERRLRLLPIISLGRFFSKDPWAQQWLDLREAEGLGLEPALPAYSEISHSWSPRRMTTGEAALYLKEFLTSSHFSQEELERIGCHSLKVTLLSWAAKGNYLIIPDRLRMGHHVSKENQSVVAYSRDELTRTMTVVHEMISDVKSHAFKPDANRAERLASAIGHDLDPEFCVESSESESDVEVEAVQPASFPKQNRASWDDLPLEMVNRLFVHRFSGVVHVAREDSPKTFLCGRLNSRNFHGQTIMTCLCVCSAAPAPERPFRPKLHEKGLMGFAGGRCVQFPFNIHCSVRIAKIKFVWHHVESYPQAATGFCAQLVHFKNPSDSCSNLSVTPRPD